MPLTHQSTKAEVLTALQSDGYQLMNASPALQADKEVVLTALEITVLHCSMHLIH